MGYRTGAWRENFPRDIMPPLKMKQNLGYDIHIYTPIIENVKAKIWAGCAT